MDVSKQMQVTQIMRTELDRISENNFARKQGLAEGLARGEAKGRAEEKRQTAKSLKELGAILTVFAATMQPWSHAGNTIGPKCSHHDTNA